MKISPLKTPRLKEGFNLVNALEDALTANRERLSNGDILVISSKVVALSQGRIVNLADIKPSERAKRMRRTRYGHGKEDSRIIELILREADAVLPGSMLMTLKEGILIPEAGIDLSNAPAGKAILWPKSPWKAARTLWNTLKKNARVTRLGIIICDSHCQPLRWGVTGIALAWAGFEGVEDARGQRDLFGKPLTVTRKALADNLSSAASVLMGEAAERVPFVLVRGAKARFTARMQKRTEIFVPPNKCIFDGIYSKGFRNAAINNPTKRTHHKK